LTQTYQFCKKYQIKQIAHADTAGATEMVSHGKDLSIGAIASEQAGEIY